jgi:hypothetical protein
MKEDDFDDDYDGEYAGYEENGEYSDDHGSYKPKPMKSKVWSSILTH